MTIAISAIGLTSPDPTRDGIDHAARAGLACLETAGVTVEDIDFLANIGVYRLHNMCEPAVCALIQNAMRMGLDARKFPSRKDVFSFDLNNGACGTLSAVMALGAMLEARKLDRALIVGADAHPSGGPEASFPFTTMGAALLLTRTPGRGGVGPLWLRTSELPFDGQRGAFDLTVHGTRSRHAIDIVRAPDYTNRLLAFAHEVSNAYLDQFAISREGLTLVCSQPDPTFATALATSLGLPPEAAVSTHTTHGDVHTSSLALGLHVAALEGRPRDNILFVEAGTGLTVGCAHYRHPSDG
jgi:3-oxoacyl-[acyl-carrier-protein] synthase-3